MWKIKHSTLNWQMSVQDGIFDVYTFDKTIFDNLALPETIEKNLTIDAIMFRYGQKPLYRTDPEWLKYFIGSWSRKNTYTWSKLQQTTLEEYNPIYNYDRTEEQTDTRDTSSKSSGTNSETESSSNSGNASSTGKTMNEGKTTDRTTRDINLDSQESTDHGHTIESTISAYNSSSYQPDKMETHGGVDHVSRTDDTNETDVSNGTSNSTVNNTESSTTTGKNDRTLSGTTGEESSGTETFKHAMRAYGNIGVTTTQQMLQSERELVQFNIYDYIADSFAREFCLDLYE